jgi:hypothetical protein
MRRVAITVLLSIYVQGLGAQAPTSSIVDSQARYQIVTSPINTRDTFRLDRWTGATAVLTGMDDTALAWTAIRASETPTTDTAPRYQLVLSGVAARGTYLIDTHTGRAWVLVGTTPDTFTWYPIK